jgi:pheromone shutdown-related protein TraB
MQSMLEELSRYLPKVKEVLIDERDRYLATKIFNVKAKKIVAVVGAGHVEGIVKFLELLEGNQAENDVTALEEVPQKHVARKILPWLVPLAVVGLFVIGFLTKGVDTSIHGLFVWVLATTIPVAVGGLLAFGHPLAILIGTVSAPVTALLPIVGAGVVSGLVQYKLRKPQVADFESLHDDINLFRRYYRNRVLKVLLVFIFENLGRLVGQIVGLSLLGSLLK